jgi:hypothetical protein
VVAGVVLIFLTVWAPGGLHMLKTQIDWYRLAPTSMLLDHVGTRPRVTPAPTGGTSIAPHSRADEELIRRIERGRLSDRHLQRLKGLALPSPSSSREGDSWAYSPNWVPAIEALHRRGDVTEAELMQLFRSSFEPGASLTAGWSERTDRGDQLRYRLTGPPAGCMERLPFGYVWSIVDVSVDGQPLSTMAIRQAHYQQFFFHSFVGTGGTVNVPELSPGPHVLTLELEFRLIRHRDAEMLLRLRDQRRGQPLPMGTNANADAWFSLWKDAPLPEPLDRWTERLSAPFKVGAD